jgi:hypothetical protein
MGKLNLEMILQCTSNVEPTLHNQIIMAQIKYKGVKIIKQKLSQEEEKYKCFRQDKNGIPWFESRIVVSKNHELQKQILDEAHLSKFSIHLGSSKMYQNLGQNF